MNSFNLLEPTPVTNVTILSAPVFTTSTIDAVPKRTSLGKRRAIGKRDGSSRVRRSLGGHIADDEDEMTASDADVDSGKDEEDDDEIVSSRATKRSRSVQSGNTTIVNKKPKVSGGRAATHKDVSHILDSDDEIIFTMKREGIKDAAIVERLIEEGRTKYEAKSIATRFSRIEKKIEEHEEQIMEEEFSDFHEEEDHALQVSQEELQTWYQRQRDSLETKYWREMAKRVNAKLTKPKYSKQACQERVESLANGTAAVPFEQDSNQEARRIQALQQIEERKAAHIAAEEEAQRPVREKQRAKAEEAKVREEARAEKEEIKANKAAEKAAEQEEKDALKAERERARQAKQRMEMREKKRRQDEQEQKKYVAAQAKLAKQQQKREEKLAKQNAMNEARMSKAEETMEKGKDRVKLLKLQAQAAAIMNPSMNEALASIMTSMSPSTTPSITPKTNRKKKSTTATTILHVKKPITPRNRVAKTKRDPRSTPSSATSKALSKPKPTPVKPRPSTSSLLSSPANNGDIRASMTVNSLRVLSRSRGLGVSGRKETLVQGLTRDDQLKGMDALKRILVERDLSCSGTKQELIDRIASHDVANAMAAGEKTTTTV